ncbi:15-hydroxyprostaglandin dehydrogenase [NAD(+)]-like [Euwallacea fornicatus]|uniref:15-hydroxyprostaglandin dehydrogenase [NAD(+)]-like n=1 Tax=Euwallacea fornicatus TaxID=995702 RepID=UPI00338D8C22
MDAIYGKVALITGGANGIGAAYVKRLFKSGMQGCTITDIDEQNGSYLAEEMNKCYGRGKAIFVKADVSDQGCFEGVLKENMKKFKKLDLLVNNAGILRDRIWDKMLDTNVSSIVRGSLLGIKYMGRNNGGCGGTIVNTASILGLQGMPGAPCYTGTQHFVIGFTRSIGTQFWFDLTGIRFMTICPGITMTPMITDAEKWVLNEFPGLGNHLLQKLRNEPSQTAEDIAEGLNTILNEGENGSIWVGEGGTPIYQVIIPKISDMKTKSCRDL